ncbi:MAG: glutathione S-transferase family protein [Brachymonas sp.]|nr:glutathione S-transferase family protein [Brachymonas sp.]
MNQALTLISHPLCPYVQRAAIVMLEKQIPFERMDIDLSNKSAWFLKHSPLGKTPVLLVNEQAIFESAVICEYLDETSSPRLHPENALLRAQHRAWMEFGSSVLNNIAAFYNAPDEATLQAKAQGIHGKFAQIEAVLGDGPYFSGAAFCVVDAVFGPVFRYFDVLDTVADFGCLTDLPKVQAWRKQLAMRASVIQAAHPDYAQLLSQFLRQRKSAISDRFAAQ